MSSPQILDGAMGTELQNRGISIPLPLWSANANIEHPQIVMEIHADYIQAGCDIITTNTFRSTFYTYRKADFGSLKSKELSRLSLYKAVECANKVAINSTEVAGSLTTIDDCYTPNAYPGRSVAEDTYGQSIEWLLDAGVDILLFETMGNVEEILCGLDMAIGCKVTLRGERMYEFLDRLVNVALPRVRDFRGLNGKSFDGNGNYSMGLKEQIVFPEIDYDQVDEMRGMDIIVVTTAKSDDEGRELLRALQFPFISA